MASPYFDKNLKLIKAGDIIRDDSGRTEKVYFANCAQMSTLGIRQPLYGRPEFFDLDEIDLSKWEVVDNDC